MVSDRLRGTIWWDFDGTLVSRPSMWSVAARRLIERASIACADLPGPLLSVLNNDMPWHRPSRAQPELSTPELWWTRVFATYADGWSRCGWSHLATPAAFDALRSEILDARAYSLFEDVVPVLTALSAERWRHVIVSNHVPELDDIVAGLGIRALFADVITSGLVGYEKPHAQMFEAAVRCAIPGAPIWMVGDNPECDCHPVGAFGANAILIRSPAPAFERHAANLWQAARLITGS
ncbi:MAG TPA: HAD-IA family hydrolase [Vicinamibacterales bacterium]|nr:HAD-IA family hydrolase [Vicinamibacterales bacterium]